jgi:hypothetical protein
VKMVKMGGFLALDNVGMGRPGKPLREASGTHFSPGGSDNVAVFNICRFDGKNCAHGLKRPAGQTIYPVTADVRRPLGRKCK